MVHHWSFEASSSLFDNNAANTEGGALALTGSNAHVEAYTAKLVGCSFRGNAVPQGRGGALPASDTRFEVSSSTFWTNQGQSGSAIYYGGASAPTGHLPTIEAASFSGNAPGPTVQADALINWICFPGQYMLQAGPFTGNFAGCYPCSAGYFGTAPNHTSPLCGGACRPGHFCSEGSTEPRPCAAGTYLPAPGAATNVSCIPCAPGSFSAILGNGNQSCTPCAPGTFSSAPGATACDSCEPGGFCASVGASIASMTFEPCPGAFSHTTHHDHHHI